MNVMGSSKRSRSTLPIVNTFILLLIVIMLGTLLLESENGRGYQQIIGARRTTSNAADADDHDETSSSSSLVVGRLLSTRVSPKVVKSNVGSEWHHHALSNFTLFRDSLFARVWEKGSWERAFLGSEDWPLFEPAISCPTGRPLTRYPDIPGDGPKLLCRVEEDALPDNCIIYSLGSNGELAAVQCQSSKHTMWVVMHVTIPVCVGCCISLIMRAY
jgi:hypothetical protein